MEQLHAEIAQLDTLTPLQDAIMVVASFVILAMEHIMVFAMLASAMPIF